MIVLTEVGFNICLHGTGLYWTITPYFTCPYLFDDTTVFWYLHLATSSVLSMDLYISQKTMVLYVLQIHTATLDIK